MRLSTKGRFAVNALIDLAQHQAGPDTGPVALATISARQQVSLSYLEQMFARLRRDGIVQSARGPGGGYLLARDTGNISVADVVRAVEDAPDAAELAADGLSQGLWQRLNTLLLDHMAGITLASLVQEAQTREPMLPAPQRPARGMALRPLPRKPVRMLPPNSVFDFGRSFAR